MPGKDAARPKSGVHEFGPFGQKVELLGGVVHIVIRGFSLETPPPWHATIYYGQFIGKYPAAKM